MTAATVAQAVGAAQTAKAARPPRPPDPPRGRAGRVVDNGAGFILGLLVWGWVIMPLIQAGPKGVRDMIRAKFLNKAPDGSWLP